MKFVGVFLWLAFLTSATIAGFAWLGYGWAQITGAFLGSIIILVVVVLAIISVINKVRAEASNSRGGDAS